MRVPVGELTRRGELPNSPPDSEIKQRARLVEQYLVEKVAKARRDPAAFFELVMREERTKRRIETAAHQRLLFDFVFGHNRSVIRMPVRTSKTFCMAAAGIWLLGQDQTNRGAIISASSEQAAKPLSMISDYIENDNRAFPELGIVFPNLRKSRRAKDPWAHNRITVDRPPGIRDPSMVAIGHDGKLPGSRLSWILVDDILDEENTNTKAAREKLRRIFDQDVLSRKDIEGDFRIVVCNTPRHSDDLTYSLEKRGWPTLTMSIDGDVCITNADGWDSDEVRPSLRSRGLEHHRLAAHDSAEYGCPFVRWDLQAEEYVEAEPDDTRGRYVDVEEKIPLWPEVYSDSVISEIKTEYAKSPAEYARVYLCRCRNDEEIKVKVDWIERCKELAKAAKVFKCVPEYRGQWPVVCGIDLAVGLDEKHDRSSFFTFACVDTIEIAGKEYRNMRLILDVDVGRWEGEELMRKVLEKERRYNAACRVETNAAQKYLKDWALSQNRSLRVRGHNTGAKNKHRRNFGVEGVFLEVENGCWLIPNDEKTGDVSPGVQEWINDLLFYDPNKHTGDVLISSWLAREEARTFGFYSGENRSTFDPFENYAGLFSNA